MKKYVIITLVLAAIGMVGGFMYATIFDKPEYTSKSRLMVRDPKIANQAKDYASIATSDSVLEYAKEKAQLSEDTEIIKSYVTAINVTGTNIIDVSVTTNDADVSKKLNQAVVNGIKDQVELLYEDDNVAEVDKASEARQTHAPNPVVRAAIGAVAGVAAGLVVVFVFYPQKSDGRKERASSDISSSDSRESAGAHDEPRDHLTDHSRPLSNTSSVDIAKARQTTHSAVKRATNVVNRTTASRKSLEDRELDDILKSLDK